MSAHSLPEGNKLIEGLARLGQALGYYVKAEQPVDDRPFNSAAVDVAWFKEEGQAYPLMIFEVESKATNSAANNPIKVFAQDNKTFEKPLFFFHVFLKAGVNNARLKNLRALFGTHNYRTYTLSGGATQTLLEDVLSQHRRLFGEVSLANLCDELSTTVWAAVDPTSPRI